MRFTQDTVTHLKIKSGDIISKKGLVHANGFRYQG